MSIPAFPLVVTLYAFTDTDKTRPGAGHFRKRRAERGQGGKSRLMTSIREATEADWPAIWALFRAVVAEGDVFAYDEETTEDTARKLWFDPPATCHVAEENGTIIGTYYVRPNQPGRGNHVAN